MGEEITIKGIGKKVIINNDSIKINKSIGKNIKILINNIEEITSTKGTLKENGSLKLRGKDEDGLQVSENISFWYSQNNIVELVVNDILNNENLIANNDISDISKVSLFEQISTENKHKQEERVLKKEGQEPRKSKREEQKERLQQLKKDKVAYCPKCTSTSLTTTNKKLSIGRAIVGGVLLNGTGAILGGLTSKKILKVCLNCGHRWK